MLYPGAAGAGAAGAGVEWVKRAGVQQGGAALAAAGAQRAADAKVRRTRRSGAEVRPAARSARRGGLTFGVSAACSRHAGGQDGGRHFV